MLQADLSLIIPGTDITWEQHVTFAHPVDNTKTKVSILSTKVILSHTISTIKYYRIQQL